MCAIQGALGDRCWRSYHTRNYFFGLRSAESIRLLASSRAIRAAKRKYFSQVQLSHATVQLINGGKIVAQAHDRGKATASKPRRLFNDHLEKLGGENTVPGKVLKMLEAKAQDTGGNVVEGQGSLTFRLWNLSGLNAEEIDGELWLAFWANKVRGGNERLWIEARKVFQKHFDTKDKRLFYKPKNWVFEFQPITRSTPLGEATRLVQRLELVYDKIRKLE
jgi:hypothetical protein